MPNVYIPLAAESPKAPGFYRTYVTSGLDIDGLCARNGWSASIPPGVDVYDENGALLQAAPKPDETDAAQVAKPARRQEKEG